MSINKKIEQYCSKCDESTSNCKKWAEIKLRELKHQMLQDTIASIILATLVSCATAILITLVILSKQ